MMAEPKAYPLQGKAPRTQSTSACSGPAPKPANNQGSPIDCNDYPIRVYGYLDVRWCEARPWLHAAGHAQCGGYGGEHADEHLQNHLPCVFFHDFRF